MRKNIYRAIGLMSGTSMDGIDIALIETDGDQVHGFGPAETHSYDDRTREMIRGAIQIAAGLETSFEIPEALSDIGAFLSDRHAEVIERFIKSHGLTSEQIDLIGFHGQTIRHAPHEKVTWQVGDGQRLADRIGVPVVGDFRRADVAAGGEGAPLAPLYHAALLRSGDALGKVAISDYPVAVLNLGGVGNVTWVADPSGGEILAFDTGPANALIDDWVQSQRGERCDFNGAYAARGSVDEALLSGWMNHPFFDLPPPKSLDRDAFAACRPGNADLCGGAATLTAFTAASIEAALRHLPIAPRLWIVCGGGRHNPVLMDMLRERLGVSVCPVDDFGWRGDSLEAEAFAFLAVRSKLGRHLSLPTTTRVPAAQTGGRLFIPA